MPGGIAMVRAHFVGIGLSVLFTITATNIEAQDRSPRASGIYVVDSGGRQTESLEVGASLEIGARGLQPKRMYEFEVMWRDKRASYARLRSDARGNINPFILWFQTGVIGC